jgi:hypothetical protein
MITRRHFLGGAIGAAALLAASPQRAFSQGMPSILRMPSIQPAKLFGVSIGGLPSNIAPLQAFEKMVGKPVDFANYYADFNVAAFDDIMPTDMIDAGVDVMLTWQPTNWDYAHPITLADILDGRHDALLRVWATQIAHWGKPLMLRFAHEMNGNWYSWGAQGHNTPAEFRAMWRHVVGIFRDAGAHNIRWVWCPNIIGGDVLPVEQFYPGDAYCDIIGIDGFNYGSVGSASQQQPAALFDLTLDEIRAFTSKSILICETGCVETSAGWADKYLAEWFDQFFVWLHEAPVAGFSWFAIGNKLNGYNLAWNVDATAASLAAFRKGIK